MTVTTMIYICLLFIAALLAHTGVMGSVLKVEAEDMDNVNHTALRDRSDASGDKSVFMVSGETIFFDLCLMSAANVSVRSLTYSNDGDLDRLEVAVDSNISVWNLETNRLAGGGNGWNQFITAISHNAPFLPLTEGRHRVTIEVLEADTYGVEIDSIVIETDSGQNVDTLKCSVFCFDEITYTDTMPYKASTAAPARAVQRSVATKCAEEDNVNIPVFHETASKFVVSASIPKYETFMNNRGPDWLNCQMVEAFWTFNNVRLESRAYSVKNRSAVLNMTFTRAFLMNEHNHTLDISFNLDGPAIGSTDSEIGAEFNLRGIGSSSDILIHFQYYGRAKTWISMPSQVFNGSTKDIVFETPDFSFSEGSGNKIRLSFTTMDQSDIVIDKLFMFKRKIKASTSTTLFKDGTTIIEGVHMDMWWRVNETMSVTVAPGSSTSHNNVDYIRVYRQVPWLGDSYCQVFVLYQDGNVRLLPLTPHGLDWIPFGSSVIIGQSDPDSPRPAAPISHLDIDPLTLTIKLFYYDGGFTTMQIRTTLHSTEVVVHESVMTRDLTSFPFFTFRSMWIANGNADVDHVTVEGAGTHGILDNWGSLRGNFFAFYRKCISKHNTLSPDIRLKVLS